MSLNNLEHLKRNEVFKKDDGIFKAYSPRTVTIIMTKTFCLNDIQTI